VPDARIEAAVANWGPRFTAQGVDPNDFARVTGPLQRWDQWLDAWVANGDLHAGLAREAERRGHVLTAGRAWVRAALAYHFAKFVWLVDLARHRAAADRAVAALRRAHGLLDPTAERLEVPFGGTVMVGTLRRPPALGRVPLVLLLPGLDSTKEEFFNWEQVFLERGMATLSLDGPGQGETGYATSIRADYEVAVTAALDALAGRAHRHVDLDRVGAVGVSLGGYYAPRAAAFEPRIRAAVAIGGPYDFGDCWDGLPQLTREAFVHHSGAAGEAEGRRLAGLLDLAPVLPRLEQPLLVIFGRLDRLVPWRQAERVAAEAPNGELVMLDDGNHVCNNMPYRYQPLAADWMRERLTGQPRPGPQPGRPTRPSGAGGGPPPAAPTEPP
jgi:pimeloyl-ACP methyl ester carboxylesterase